MTHAERSTGAGNDTQADTLQTWIGWLAERPEALEVPLDLPRPALRNPLWAKLAVPVPAAVSAKLSQRARDANLQDEQLCFAAYAVFLGKIANARELIVGWAGRPLALRLAPEENILQLAVRLAIRAREVDATPLESLAVLARALELVPDPSRHPLFDASFGGDAPLGDLHLRVVAALALETSPEPALSFELSYDARLFSPAMASRLSRSFSQLLAAAVEGDLPVGQLPLLNQEDTAELLGEFSTPVFNWGHHLVLHELFEAKVDQNPAATALVFNDQRLTYAELERRANIVAHALTRAGIGPDAIVALLQERTPEMIIAILAVLKAGGAWLPIEPDVPKERLQYLLSDSGAALVLTTSALKDRITRLSVLCVDELLASASSEENLTVRLPRRAEPNHLAYVIYTSGSTGQPKGVLIEHRNVVHLVLAEKDEMGVRSNDALILLSSYSFDASIDQIWLALASGGKLVLVEKETILDPPRLAKLVAAEQVTHLDSVPALLGELNPSELPSVKRVVVGGETCPIAVALAWRGSARFFNEYGPTETTVGSLRHLVEPNANLSGRVPIGRPIGMTRVYILDWGGCLVPVGVRGELHLGGAGVARGYLNREALSKEKFLADPFALEANARMYRTGDLVSWLEDGSVEFFGRADSQIKLRGFRIELGEVEAALLAHAEITGAAVSVFGERAEQQRLVCHLVASRPLAAAELRAFLAKSLPGYMVPDLFLQLDAFPRTVSGKIDRRKLPVPTRIGEPVEHPVNLVEAEVRALWAELLSAQPEQLDVTRSFFEVGGHSLLVMKLVARIERKFGVALPAGTILAAPTIREIAAAVAAAEPVAQTTSPAELGLALPATSVQRRMYVIQQGNPRSTSYNIPLLYEVVGSIAEEALAGALTKLIERHESLRTAFFFQEGEILQKITQSPPFKLERFELDSISLDDASAAFVRPFVLEAPPLFRAAVFVKNGAVKFLALDMHHIISDGTSVDALLEDLLALAHGETLPEEKARYFDYATWLTSEPGRARLRAAKSYWSTLLRDELPVLELPHDFRRPLSRQQSAGDVTVLLDKNVVNAIGNYSREHGATPFAFFSAVYSVFLSCLTGSADTVFGFPTAGRPHPDFERVVGMFVNTLVFRSRIVRGKSFDTFLREAARQIRESLTNEEYPFEELVGDLRLLPVPGRNPIFDTMLSYEGKVPSEHRCGEALLREKRLTQRLARMDLVLVIRETEAGYSLLFEYSADLFKRSTVERFSRELTAMIGKILEEKKLLLTELHTLSESAREAILHGFNDTEHALPSVRGVHELFEKHAQERPDAVAVEMGEEHFTYAEVDARANALAARLRAEGIGRDVLVGILLDPCSEMLVSVLAVLKAGGAFMPIDPDYPFARKAHMIKDSGTAVVLSRGALASDLRDAFSLRVIDLADASTYAAGPRDAPRAEVERSDLAYVIYTSGSTGQPKGTLIEHRNLLNFACWYADYFRIKPGDGVSKYAGFGFDASISEMVPTFIHGARLVVVPAELRLSIDELDQYFAEHKVAIAFLPTQFGEQFLRHAKKNSLRSAFLGGEKLRNKPTDRCEIINGYGPTEYTVAATAFRVDKAYDNIPIGKPLWNTQILILDRLGRVCPVGVAGELCIAGASMGRGYLNQPALTAEKFVEHPFSPGRRMYRTGDLARWVADGNVEFLGRIDTQVKVRGFRVELGEIEQALMALVEIREAIVLARENPAVPGDLSLVAFVTSAEENREAQHDEAQLKAALARTLPAYMIPSRIIQLAEIPLTANGKVDKRSLPQVELDLSAVIGPRTETESELRKIYAEVLGAKEESISVESSFLELGGHSLKAAVLLSAIYQRTGLQLRLAKFLAASSIAEVAREVDALNQAGESEEAKSDEAQRDDAVEKGDALAGEDRRAQLEEELNAAPLWESPPEGKPLPLTSSQRRIFAVHQLSSWSTAYNIPFAWELKSGLELDRLARALTHLIDRHEALRASFTTVDGIAQQEFLKTARLKIERISIDDTNLRVTLDRFVQPFDLEQAPLVRAAFVTTESRTVLALDLHHIVADGLSVRVLLEELEAIYLEKPLEDPSPSFADYVWWEASEAGRATREAEKNWWLERFAERPSQLELPCDFDRPPRLSFEGDEVSVLLPAETSAPLFELARARNITPLGVFLSAWAVVLSRLGNTPDVVIGVPAAGRHKRGMERLVGMFVNTVPLRLKLRADEPFSELCVRIGSEAAEAFDRQSYQLNDLVTDLSLSRDPSRNPLFDVLFSWEDEELAQMENSALGLKEVPPGQQPCKFDLELTVQSAKSGQRLALLFSRKLFQRATAERFLGNLRSVLEQAGRTPDSALRDFRMLQPWEREMLLEDFNKTEVAVSSQATLVDLFAAHVRATPDAIAVEDSEESISYQELDRRASALAAVLISRGVESDDLVALSMQRTRNVVVAILGVFKSGAGYLPIDPETPHERAALIFEDSKAKLLVADAGSLGLDPSRVLAWSELCEVDQFGSESNNDLSAGADRTSRAKPNAIAYVIYTSGSTGKPKGVVIEHRNVASFLETSKHALEIKPDDRILLFSSFTFDASVEQYGLALVSGARLVVASKETLLDHDAFEEWILARGITHLDTVPLFLSGYTPKRALPLRRIVAGGDICPIPVAARWAASAKFFNEYGPTETTVTALRHEVVPDDLHLPRLPIGRPVANTRIYILDWTGNVAPLGVPGEMYIGGAGVARGYLNNPALTQERFLESAFVPGDRLYRTGDIARWTSEGTIDFLGRADNQVKIRGFRIELGEIEAALLRHPAVAEAAVIVLARGEEKRLCAYVVLRTQINSSEVRNFLSRTLPSYMVPDALVALESLPVTTSGKIDRKRLPEPGFESAAAGEAPATPAEEKLIEIWSEVLKLPAHRIPLGRSFFELGGHSLLIMILITRIQQIFSVRLTPADVFDQPTIHGLARLIEEHERQAIVPIPKLPEREIYPLSSVQRRLYAIHQANPLSVSYNMPTVFTVEGRVTRERLEEVVRALIHRHASIRTSFELLEGEPVARIHPTAPFSLETIASDEPLDALMQRLMQPFDLSLAPLLRVWLVHRSSGPDLLVADLHHIMVDGYSTAILWREVSEIIRGVSLAPLRLNYGDFAAWQNSAGHHRELERQRDFWLAQFATMPPQLQLPYDFRRPAVRSNAGDLVVVKMSREEAQALAQLSRAQDSTLFATLLSCFFVFLSRIGNADDLVVGVPVSGRVHPDVQELVGMFVNTVPWRARVPDAGSFLDFLASTKKTSLGILSSEEYQLEELLEAKGVQAQAGHNPLFDVMFVFETGGAELVDAGKVKLRFAEFLHRTAKMDLVLIATESESGLELAFEYATELFERKTVERLARHFQTLLTNVLRDPKQPLAALELLLEEERREIVVGFNQTAHELPAIGGVHALFEEWVKRTPDAPAVVFENESWSYAEVDRKANQIAAWLQSQQIGSGAVVAILLDPCAEQLPAILGVLKAGAAFLPVDSEYPAGRKSYMLEDSRARSLLSKASLAAEIEFSGPRFDLGEIPASNVAAPRIEVKSSDAAYVIYTSGSTGKPKGVVIEHGGLLNFSLWYADYFGVSPGDGVSKYAGFSFDASISEIFPACLSGAVLVVVPAALRLAPRELSAYFEEKNVRVAFLPTAFGEQFLRLTENKSLRVVALAGEKLRAFRPAPWKVVNAYGPTEYTVCTSAFIVERPFENIPIGKPVWNTQVLVLDRRGRICPVGVAGELCVSGKSIARGYLGRPDLTAEKFVKHPLNPGERSYRSGDLARWLPDGNLEFLGRIDSQVKVRGFRVELGEIEQTLLDVSLVKEAVVVDLLDESNTTYLVAYLVAASGILEEKLLRTALARHLPDYMIPAHFLQLASLPLTANGKLDRRALPAVQRNEAALIVAPENDLERKLLGLWASVLNLDAAKLGVTNSFLDLGGHSLKAIALTGEIYRAFKAELRVSDIFRHPTVRGQAERLALIVGPSALGAGESAIGPAPAAESHPASSVQARMFLLQQMEPESVAYNVASLFAVAEGTTREQLGAALAELTFRHDAFRASFFLDGADLRLRVQPSVSLPIPIVKTTEAAREEAIASLVLPFNLAAAPLARAAWLETETSRYLFFDMHHIVTDGVSMGLLIEELEKLVRGDRLEESARGLVDCTVWENGKYARSEVARQKEYWRGRFADGIPALGLLTDLPRPPVVMPEGETLTRALPGELARSLRALAQQHKLSLHALLLAAFKVFLARLTRQEEIAIGTPVSGRWHPDMQRVFGMFVNTLVLKSTVDGKQPFLELAREVSRRSIEALDNQAFPFSELVELLGDGRHAGHTPLFDVMFAMQNADDRLENQTATLTPVAVANTTSKFDLSLVADEGASSLSLSIEFRNSLFRRATIERFLRSLAVLLGEIAARPEAPVASLSILSEEDRQRVQLEFNRTEKNYPDEIAAHRMFEKMAGVFGERRALVQGDRSFTYAEVDAAANRLAHRLVSLGVGRDSIVAILTPPSCELIIAELATLKAGGAFLPLDHRYPRDRLEYTLRDSSSQVLLAAGGLDKDLDWPGARLVLSPALFLEGDSTPPELEAKPGDLAYVIYTSGSTGRPKGVAVEHASLVPFIQRTIDFYGLTERDRHSKYAGIGFDVSIIETFPPLCRGGELHIVPEEIRLSPPEIAEWANRSGITWMDLPTQLAEEFISVPRETKLRWMTVGGDRLRRYTKTKFKLANEYGPTEFTVSATTFVVEAQSENIPIGKPTANTKVFILDPLGQLCPPGVPGEICLAGKQLTRGYLGNPEMTAKKFVQHPLAGRLYHTGDLGRWLDDGNIEFLGRIDSQVKIRGFRIELGEIEQAILEVPGISRAVVIDRQDKAGDKFLCGYFVPAPGNEPGEAQIREALARRLPDYMVPPALMRLAEIPFSTSGKVDLRKLPEPELQKRERVAVAPSNVAEALVVDAFSRTLGRSDLGVDDDFFDFGGNSLKAVTVVAALAGDFRITANDLFRLRTARAVARELPMQRGDLQQRLHALVEEIRNDAEEDPFAGEEMSKALAAYRARCESYQSIPLAHQKSYRDVFLTGATGFLGSYLLRDLLLNSDAKVYVAIRAKHRREAWDRLVARAAYYFGPEMLEANRRRVILVPGDLAQPSLGLDRGSFEQLGRTIDCVIHTAALTKHYGDYSAFVSANVDATQNVIALARQAACDFNLVSTVSVGAGAIEGRTRALFTEFDCDIGQLAGNHYVRTKLEAEKLAIGLRSEGLVANIFRVGFLTGDSSSLRFQENAGDSGFVQTLRSYIALKRMPLSALTQSFCPVNEVSQAILRLLPLTALSNETHHIDRVIEPHEAEQILAANDRCAPMDDASFFEWLAKHLGDPGVGQAAAAVLLHEGILDESPPTETITLREKTAKLLARIGFSWSPVSQQQVWSLAGE